MVPADWQHPKEYNAYRREDCYKPLLDGNYAEAAADWDRERADWEAGNRPSYASDEHDDMPYDQWAGQRPFSGDYMPQWSDAERTHYMMYESTSEGTPISPAFATPEELARWLVDNGASAFAGQTAGYESWLRVANGGYACSAVISNGVMTSGVAGI
jgi:hypothetical protein